MRYLMLALFLGGCASVPTPPPEAPKQEEPPGVCMAPEQVERCGAGGGCVFATKEQIQEALIRAYERGLKKGAEDSKTECWANT